MKKLILMTLLMTQIIWANNLEIGNVTKSIDGSGNTVLDFDVSWDNSWHVEQNGQYYYDAAWIFIKSKNSAGVWSHVDINHLNLTLTGFTNHYAPDYKGIKIRTNTLGFGTTTGHVSIGLQGDFGLLPDFKVFGIEMVYINTGDFYLGDGVSSNRFYQGNDDTLPYHVQNNGEITFGNTASDLYRDIALTNNIPSTYPTGYSGFYTMKYEITQEQYVEFLNTLTPTQQQLYTHSDLNAITSSNRFVLSNTGTVVERNGVACDANAQYGNITFYTDFNNNAVPNELDDGQNIACNYLNPAMSIAYLKWAAMRPMTDMEYEKVCRGPSIPLPNDKANGSILASLISTITNSGLNNESVDNIGTNGLINYNSSGPIRVGAFATSTSNRLQSGAGYYGVMDLSGNVEELTIDTRNSSLAFNKYIYYNGSIDTSNNLFIGNIANLKGNSYILASSQLNNVSYSLRLFLISEVNAIHVNPRGCR